MKTKEKVSNSEISKKGESFGVGCIIVTFIILICAMVGYISHDAGYRGGRMDSYNYMVCVEQNEATIPVCKKLYLEE